MQDLIDDIKEDLNYDDLKSSDPFIRESAKKKLQKIEESENMIEKFKNELKESKEKVNKKRREFEEKQSEVISAEKKFKKAKEKENQEIKEISNKIKSNIKSVKNDIDKLNYKIEKKADELKIEEINLTKLDHETYKNILKNEDKIEQLKSKLDLKDQFSTDPEKREHVRKIIKQIEESESAIDELNDTLYTKKDNVNKIIKEMDE